MCSGAKDKVGKNETNKCTHNEHGVNVNLKRDHSEVLCLLIVRHANINLSNNYIL